MLGLPCFPAQVENFEFQPSAKPLLQLLDTGQPTDRIKITIRLLCIGDGDNPASVQRRRHCFGERGNNRPIRDDLFPFAGPVGVGLMDEIGFQQHPLARVDETVPPDSKRMHCRLHRLPQRGRFVYCRVADDGDAV